MSQVWVGLMKSKYGTMCTVSQKQAVSTGSSSPLYSGKHLTAQLLLWHCSKEFCKHNFDCLTDVYNYLPLLTQKAQQPSWTDLLCSSLLQRNPSVSFSPRLRPPVVHQQQIHPQPGHKSPQTFSLLPFIWNSASGTPVYGWDQWGLKCHLQTNYIR